MKTVLIGIDPGVVDTGMVIIVLDTMKKSYSVEYEVYTDMSDYVDNVFLVNKAVLARMRAKTDTLRLLIKDTHVYIEGYRNRGRNMRQDQQMTSLVQSVHKILPGSFVIDNTGVKNVVKPAFMKLFGFAFPRTNHADLESAARIALKGAIQNTDLNVRLSNFVRDALDGKAWTHETSV